MFLRSASLVVGLWLIAGHLAIAQALPAGTPVLPVSALFATPVYGLDQTNAQTRAESVSGEPFTQALRVSINADNANTNATQLCMPVAIPVTKGDTILATFYVRGRSAISAQPAELAFVFERSQPPWRGSITQGVSTARKHLEWKRVVIAFAASEDYPLGQAQVSLRFAFGPQIIEVGGISVLDFGTAVSPASLAVATQNALGDVRLAVDFSHRHQTMLGFGGDFCQPRYGSSSPMDPVGAYVLAHLKVAQARVGIPLEYWAPSPGVYNDNGPAHAALLQMQLMAQRHIPIIGTVWEGPTWLLPGVYGQRRTLPTANYGACIEAIAQFLVTARDRYGVTVQEFSFNEANYGVNFQFTPEQIADFIRQAGPRFAELGLKTKFLVGDTTGGMPFSDYVGPILADPSVSQYLGPLAFHCWDALSAPADAYRAIAAVGRRYHKPIYCTEVGFDAGLWQASNPWPTWDNALKTAQAYVKTIRLSGASAMDYWTYQDNYPIVSEDGRSPYPVFDVVNQMESALLSGCRIVSTQTDSDDLEEVAAVGPSSGRLALVIVNPIGPGTVTITGLPAGASIAATVSDARAQIVRLQWPRTVAKNGKLSLPIPADCVVTVVGRS